MTRERDSVEGMGAGPRISVVTVSFNAAAEFEGTAESVHAQTYRNLEYIVVDGGSTDGTVGLIERRGLRIDRWVSEPDRGIYHAMNKGAGMASGDFIIFLNAGDKFLHARSLEQLTNSIRRSRTGGAAFFYTDHYVDYVSGSRRLAKSESPSRLWLGMVACHQAVAHPSAAFGVLSFDETKRLAADYKFLQEAADLGFPLIQLADVEPLVVCTAGGVSDLHRIAVIREYASVRGRWPRRRLFLRAVFFGWRLVKEALKSVIKRMLRLVKIRRPALALAILRRR